MDVKIKNSPTTPNMILKIIALLSLRDLKLPSLNIEPVSNFKLAYGRRAVTKNISATRVSRNVIAMTRIFLDDIYNS
jgi:hypothetical protein